MRNFLNKTLKVLLVLLIILSAYIGYLIYLDEGLVGGLQSFIVSSIFIYLVYFVLNFFVNVNILKTKQNFSKTKVEKTKDLNKFKQVLKFTLINTPIALVFFYGGRFLMINSPLPFSLLAQAFALYVGPLYLIVIVAKLAVGFFHYVLGHKVSETEEEQNQQKQNLSDQVVLESLKVSVGVIVIGVGIFVILIYLAIIMLGQGSY